MKIIVGLIQHESNSFNPDLTNMDDFIFLAGEEIIKNPESYKDSSLEGIINVLSKRNVEIIPTVLARATSEGGLVSRKTYQEIKGQLLEQISKENRDIDGICLALHGSMTVEEIGDAEGDLLQAIRKITGYNIPIVCSLDMHAIVTEKMLKNADAFISYRTAPHIDKVETGEKAAEILYDSLINQYLLYTAAVELPILISGEKSESDKPPMKDLYKEIARTDRNPGVIAASYCLGFPWVDTDFNTGSVLVITKNNPELAQNKAIELAAKFMERLSDFDFTTETYPFNEAIKIADNEKKGPVFVIDSGDNPGAGGSQNITCTLDYILSQETNKVLYAVIADKSACQSCIEKQINSEVFVRLGKRDENIGSVPLELQGRVKCSGKYKNLDAVVINVNNIDIIITSQKIVLTEPDFFKTLGLNFNDYQIVVLKSGYLDPELKPYTERVLLGLSPGYTNQVLQDLNYKRIKRPVYPFDNVSDLDLKYIIK